MLDKLSNIRSIEKIIIIPTKIPPHKQVSFLAKEEDRVKMCELVAKKYNNVEVSTIELNRVGKSYTIDTLMYVKAMYPDKRVAITIGADMVVTFDEWKEYKKIIENSIIITFSRAGTDIASYQRGIDLLKSWGAELIVIEDEITAISSTMIRDLLSSGSPLNGLVDKEICDYIYSNNVYEV